LRRAVLAVLVALATALPAAAETLALDPDGMRRLALAAEQSGALDTAGATAAALIARDPADLTGLIVASRVARTRGDGPAARGHARAAWASARTPAARHLAALTMAQALASGGRRVEAQFWLRRAIHHAPTPAARALAVRDFGYVRARSALRFRLDLSVAPSTNVNNGSRHSEIPMFGGTAVLLSAKALPGGFVTAGLALRYRLFETPAHLTELTFSAQHRAVWLDPAGAALASPGDYVYTAVEAGIAHRRRVLEGRAELSAEASVGHNWYGGAPLSNTLRLDAGLALPAGAARSLRLRGSWERQWRLDVAARSAEVVTLGVGVTQGLANGDRLRLDLVGRHAGSASPEVSHVAAGLRLGWERAQPVAGVRLEMGLAAEARDYGPIPTARGGRRDLRLEASAALSFDRAEVLGFVPVMTLRAERTMSTSLLHDGQDFGLGLGIRSRF
jgi:hypothetical protein